jgi:Isochorismatase family
MAAPLKSERAEAPISCPTYSTKMNEEHTMSKLEGKQKQIATYEPNITAVLCVDHYNDFLSERGKLWPWVKDVAQEVNLLDNLRNIVRTARESNIAIFHVPHHRSEPGDTRTGNIRLLINFRDQRTRSLPKALGAVRSMTTSRCNRAISL